MVDLATNPQGLTMLSEARYDYRIEQVGSVEPAFFLI